MVHGASGTSPIIWNDPGAMPVKKLTISLKSPVCGCSRKRPEVTDHGGRKHHRQQDQRGPETMAAKLPVDQQRKTEAQQHFKSNRPEHEARGHLHRVPDIFVVKDVDVVVDPHKACRNARHVRLEVGVNDSRSAQINGKMLIASSSTMVGRMKSHAMARSDSPPARLTTRVDAPASRRVGGKGLFANMPDSFR